MSIILPHTTSDIQFFRSNGVCYRRTDWGVEGTPNTSWDEVVDTPYNDFGTYASCESCRDAVSTPPICPCTYTTFAQLAAESITSCGYALDPIYRQYRFYLSNFEYCPGHPTYSVSEDQALLDNVVTAQGGTPCSWVNNLVFNSSLTGEEPIRIPGTLYAIYGCSPYSSQCGLNYTLNLVQNYGWVFSSGTTSWTYIWRKKTGVTPAGVYTALACGETAPTYTGGTPVASWVLNPSSILIEAIIP